MPERPIVKPIPWGRNASEYLAMFALDDVPTTARILDVAGGPASFAAERSAQGAPTVACDPLYANEKEHLATGIELARESVMRLVREEKERFVWTTLKDPETLERTRMKAMHRFLDDFEAGCASGRYRTGALPNLPFEDDSFDLALCSHFLFLYSEDLDLSFHVTAIEELLRVAPLVRIFPLLEMNGQPSRHLERVLETLDSRGHRPRIQQVSYEFQRGGDEHLEARRSEGAPDL